MQAYIFFLLVESITCLYHAAAVELRKGQRAKLKHESVILKGTTGRQLLLKSHYDHIASGPGLSER